MSIARCHPERNPAEIPLRYTSRGFAVRLRYASLRMTRRDVVEPGGRCHLWHRDLGRLTDEVFGNKVTLFLRGLLRLSPPTKTWRKFWLLLVPQLVPILLSYYGSFWLKNRFNFGFERKRKNLENAYFTRVFEVFILVGAIGIEPTTLCMSSIHSDQLSYTPRA